MQAFSFLFSEAKLDIFAHFQRENMIFQREMQLFDEFLTDFPSENAPFPRESRGKPRRFFDCSPSRRAAKGHFLREFKAYGAKILSRSFPDSRGKLSRPIERHGSIRELR
jgi:hypothetical protein